MHLALGMPSLQLLLPPTFPCSHPCLPGQADYKQQLDEAQEQLEAQQGQLREQASGVDGLFPLGSSAVQVAWRCSVAPAESARSVCRHA